MAWRNRQQWQEQVNQGQKNGVQAFSTHIVQKILRSWEDSEQAQTKADIARQVVADRKDNMLTETEVRALEPMRRAVQNHLDTAANFMVTLPMNEQVSWVMDLVEMLEIYAARGPDLSGRHLLTQIDDALQAYLKEKGW